MTAPTTPWSAPTLQVTDLAALLDLHRRLVDATLRCNSILAGAARAWAERQATIARTLWADLGGAGPAVVRAALAGEPPLSAERAAGLVEGVGTELVAMQRSLMEAHLAMLQELGRALSVDAAAAEATPSASEAEPAPVVGQAGARENGAAAASGAVEAEPVAAPAEAEGGEAGAKPRRGRRTAVAL